MVVGGTATTRIPVAVCGAITDGPFDDTLKIGRSVVYLSSVFFFSELSFFPTNSANFPRRGRRKRCVMGAVNKVDKNNGFGDRWDTRATCSKKIVGFVHPKNEHVTAQYDRSSYDLFHKSVQGLAVGMWYLCTIGKGQSKKSVR